jgi:hypothetical protein
LACACFRVWTQATSWYLLVFWSVTIDLLYPHRSLDLTFTYKCFMYDCSWLLVIVNIVIFCISEELDDTAVISTFSILILNDNTHATTSNSVPRCRIVAAWYVSLYYHLIVKVTVPSMQCSNVLIAAACISCSLYTNAGCRLLQFNLRQRVRVSVSWALYPDNC